MKELSIEEKAQAYDKVVNKLKGFMAQGVDPLITRADVQDFFPELAESEDERIRKALIKLVKKVGEGYEDVIEGVSIENAISWLEKQGEHANFRNKIQIGDKVTRNEDGVLVNLSQLNRVAKKQGEQKPIPNFKVGDVVRSSNGESLLIEGITDYCYNCVICATNDKYSFGFDIQDEFELVEQKHWSEEDEEALEEAIIALEDMYSENSPFDCYVGHHMPFDKAANQLKSIKERVIPQPQQEWSEKDEAMLIRIKGLLNNALSDTNKSLLVDILNWLDKHYSQKIWKPSKKQIMALRWVLNQIPYNSHKEEISGLLDQIKNL